MNAFTDMQDLLQDFLTEAGELLDDVDQKLVELEHNAGDKNLLNTIETEEVRGARCRPGRTGMRAVCGSVRSDASGSVLLGSWCSCSDGPGRSTSVMGC